MGSALPRQEPKGSRSTEILCPAQPGPGFVPAPGAERGAPCHHLGHRNVTRGVPPAPGSRICSGAFSRVFPSPREGHSSQCPPRTKGRCRVAEVGQWLGWGEDPAGLERCQVPIVPTVPLQGVMAQRAHVAQAPLATASCARGSAGSPQSATGTCSGLSPEPQRVQ